MAEFVSQPCGLVPGGYGICVVPRCERPWRSSGLALCSTHHQQRSRYLKVPLDEFVVHPKVKALPAFGPCEVLACTRDRDGNGPYCMNHQTYWNQARRQADAGTGEPVDPELFRRTSRAVMNGTECSMRGLPDRVVAELLFGLEQRTASGTKTRTEQFRPLVSYLLAHQLGSIEEVVLDDLPQAVKITCSHFIRDVRRTRMSPETERHKDVWDVTVFGFKGNLRFGTISQPWLREAAKVFAYNELPHRRGGSVKDLIQQEIKFVALLSDSLRLQRPGDLGNDPRLLSRSDIAGFLNRLWFLVEGGFMTSYMRNTAVQTLRRVLIRMRGLGLTRHGQPMHGLADDFAFEINDIPVRAESNPQVRDLPVEVMRHICSHLDDLEELATREVRVAVELLIDTGRRPDEICCLDWDCLDRDERDKPVLIYTNFKANRLGRRLPIAEATAAGVLAQQQRVRARFPNERVEKLKLLPSTTRNPHGTRPVSDEWVTTRHHQWILGLPAISVPVSVEIAGKLGTQMLAFDVSRIFLYAYRHTYAQRHADAGIAPDILRQLMDHRLMQTTQAYYRVGEKRRREAVDRVTTMQFDRHGNKVWREAKMLLDAEHLRRAVGEVAVPYGTCSEPSNVAAGGDDCPVRFRCVGCSHFSTDVSYLPDLEAYLADLLRSRERLRGALDADEWAKTEAMPSDEEIIRIRRLIARIKTDVDELSASEQAQIAESVAVVRRARNQVVGLGT
ncbi:tyrosine-type recombinase/integrase, partial [Nocardia sp. NPDC058497]|uniref:tyrosine-type recombinase/integrase n=1 Tax=Nocardia sp. NPDC058497 TaxID=3346529 RepID=UPI003656F28E